jgi:hypothetical protein
MKKLLLLPLLSVVIFAQTPTHSVTITWADTANPAGTNYNAYRLVGACPSTPPTSVPSGFTKINSSPIVPKTYVDATVTGGTTYCYFVTATKSTAVPNESVPSNDVAPTVPTLFPPTLIQITILQ